VINIQSDADECTNDGNMCSHHDEMQMRGPGASPRMWASAVSSLSALIWSKAWVLPACRRNPKPWEDRNTTLVFY